MSFPREECLRFGCINFFHSHGSHFSTTLLPIVAVELKLTLINGFLFLLYCPDFLFALWNEIEASVSMWVPILTMSLHQ